MVSVELAHIGDSALLAESPISTGGMALIGRPIQARALIVNGGTLFSPSPHLFFRRGTRRPTAMRLQKEEPHTPSPLARRRRKFCKWHSLHVDFAGKFGRTDSWTHSSTRPTFELGILTRKPRKIGLFEQSPRATRFFLDEGTLLEGRDSVVWRARDRGVGRVFEGGRTVNC